MAKAKKALSGNERARKHAAQQKAVSAAADAIAQGRKAKPTFQWTRDDGRVATEPLRPDKKQDAQKIAKDPDHQALHQQKIEKRKEQVRRSVEKNAGARQLKRELADGDITEITDGEMQADGGLPSPIAPIARYRVYRCLAEESDLSGFDLVFEGAEGRHLFPAMYFLTLAEIRLFLRGIASYDEMRANALGEEYYLADARKFLAAMDDYKKETEKQFIDIERAAKTTGEAPVTPRASLVLKRAKSLVNGSLGFAMALDALLAERKAREVVANKSGAAYRQLCDKMASLENEQERVGYKVTREFTDEDRRQYMINERKNLRARVFDILRNKAICRPGWNIAAWAEKMLVQLFSYPHHKTREQITQTTGKTRANNLAEILNEMGLKFGEIELYKHQIAVVSVIKQPPFRATCFNKAEEIVRFNQEGNHLPCTLSEIEAATRVFSGQTGDSGLTNMAHFNYTLLGFDAGVRPQELFRLVARQDENGIPKDHLCSPWDIDYMSLITKTRRKKQKVALAPVSLNLLSHILLNNRDSVLCSLEPTAGVLTKPRNADANVLRNVPDCQNMYERRERTTCLSNTAWCKHTEDDTKREKPNDLRLKQIGGYDDMTMVDKVYARNPCFDKEMIRKSPGEYYGTKMGYFVGGVDVLQHSCSYDAYLLKLWHETWSGYLKRHFLPEVASQKMRELDEITLKSFLAWTEEGKEKHRNRTNRVEDQVKNMLAALSSLAEMAKRVENATASAERATTVTQDTAAVLKDILRANSKLMATVMLMYREGRLEEKAYDELRRSIDDARSAIADEPLQLEASPDAIEAEIIPPKEENKTRSKRGKGKKEKEAAEKKPGKVT